MKALLFVIVAGVFSLTASAQIPKLNSYTAAQPVIFLDFDGQTVQGTGWNWNGPIHAQAATLSNTAIAEIFERVAEDYRIFNINVTTDSTKFFAAPIDQRTRIIVTPTSAWYGLSGGVAYVGSFAFGDDTPAWVFSTLLENNVKKVSEAISHEAGHTLGLQHQSTYDVNCTKLAEYSQGQGTGEIGWSPIMGVGYYRNLTTWHNGPNTIGCDVLQDDIDIIAGSNNNVGLRADEHPNRHQQATSLTITGSSFQANGIVNTATDKDVFQFRLLSSTNLKLSAVPRNVGGSHSGADVDLRVSLLNRNGDTLSKYNPGEKLNVIIDTTLKDDTYYLVVEGVGNPNLLDYGSLGYYSLSATLATTLPLQQFDLQGQYVSGSHLLNWRWKADEAIKTIAVETSDNGRDFTNSKLLSSAESVYKTVAPQTSKTWYRLKITTTNDRVYYSNIVVLRGNENSLFRLSSTVFTNSIQISARIETVYQLIDQTGKTIQKGNFPAGTHQLTLNAASRGIYLLQLSAGADSQTFKLIKQ